MNLHCRFVGLAIFASANFLQFQHLLTQTPGATATIRFSNGQSLATNDFSDLIGVQPNELVNVTIQFPAGDVGETIKIASLDGGQVTSSSRTVSDEGFLTFSFQAPPNAGQDRV